MIIQNFRATRAKHELWLALAYPLVLMTIALAIVGFILFCVVPQFAPQLEEWIGLPTMTYAVVALSAFGLKYWSWILSGLAASAIVVFCCSRTLSPRKNWTRFLPVFAPLFRQANVGEFCHIHGACLESGIQLATAIRIAGQANRDQGIKEASLRLADDIDRGMNIQDAAVHQGFPFAVARTLSNAESPASLAASLHELASVMINRADENSRSIARTLEPFFMAVIVLMISFVFVGLFMPYLNVFHQGLM
ncbi:MAG: hypothetical protein FJ267_10610 [Planctomycetes bacterium]|nr:hypothetical protein [Planctomycetota bacterium]